MTTNEQIHARMIFPLPLLAWMDQIKPPNFHQGLSPKENPANQAPQFPIQCSVLGVQC
jgi:hypothetical protein